ncbi:MAG: CotH kinase family protein [Proteobacteria bacterium]|nr:CotH kinase family protein [Pseudomonadota bacterium]
MRKLLPILCLLIVGCGGGGGGSSNVELPIPNIAPTISGSVTEIRVGEPINFQPSASDQNNDPLTFSIAGAPAWSSFDASSGLLTGKPSEDDLGSTYSISITVSDGALSSSISFDLTIIRPLFKLNIDTSSMAEYMNMAIIFSACFLNQEDEECADGEEEILISQNGITSSVNSIEAGSLFALSIDRQPGRQNCLLSEELGQIAYGDQLIVVECKDDESAALFNDKKLHRIRITMPIEEWERFGLDYERANYKNGNARGELNPWAEAFWSHSEIYRQADFEYLNSDGNVETQLKNVGFKMKGNTSRRAPAVDVIQQDGSFKSIPQRFSFSIKFDEKFDENEGVYACIDQTGSPAAIAEPPCLNRVGKDIEVVPENDDRAFMGLEKVYFRYNRDDPSYQRELLAHTILNQIGVPTSRVAHASIELVLTGLCNANICAANQVFNMGIFQMVEQVDKTFLERLFRKNGFLFKVAGRDLAETQSTDPLCIPYEDESGYSNAKFCDIGVEKPDPLSREEWLGVENYLNPSFVNSDINDGGEVSQFKPYEPNYDLKSKKSKIKDGRELLQDFIKFVQTSPSSAMLAEKFDVQGFIKAQAADIAMGAPDHYARVANNFYLYFNPLTSKWVYIATDYDFVFRDHHPQWGLSLNAFQDIAYTYAFPAFGKVSWTDRELGDVTPILWDIIFATEANRDLLYKDLRSILDNQLDWVGNISELLDERDDLVRSVIQSTDAINPSGCQHSYNPSAIDSDSMNLCDFNDISIKKFIEIRRNTLNDELSAAGF